MPASVELNHQIRSLLDEADARRPGFKLHAERVAVYAVATAERLGFSDEDLITVRITAELFGMAKLPKHLDALIQTDGTIQQIVRLSDKFVQMQDVGGQGLSWIQYEAFHHYDRRYVAALREVEPIITPAEIPQR